MKTLREVKSGETVTVVKLNGEGAVKRRIMDMGITKGCSVFIRKVAPLGDPVEVTVRGYELSVRKKTHRWSKSNKRIYAHQRVEHEHPLIGIVRSHDRNAIFLIL